MGLPNAYGLKYLRYDDDTRIYTYLRQLNAKTAPYVVGTVLRSWTTRIATLTGRPVVKISLGAAGKDEIGDRHATVHAQVNEIVGRAILQVQRDARARKTLVELKALSGEEIAILAQQERHDILDQHDREIIDPSARTSLADVLLTIARKSGMNSEEWIRPADAAARNLEEKHARKMIVRRELDNFDRSMKEYDFSLDRLKSLNSEHIGKQLPPEALSVLLDRPPIAEGASEIDAILAKSGVSMPKGHPDRLKLGLAATRARIEALSEIKKRDGGTPIATPPRPVLPLPEMHSAPTLRDLHAEWVGKSRMGAKTVEDNKLYVDRFIALHGDLPVTAIEPLHIKIFRDTLKKFPRNVPAKLRKATPDEIVAWHGARKAENPEVKSLGWFTINEKGIRGISKLMQIAVDGDVIAKDPCRNMYLNPDEEEDCTERRPFELEDLRLIFGADIYGNPPARPLGGAGEAARWLPLIALFTGMRLEEIGQLLVEDVKMSPDGLPYFLVSTVVSARDTLASIEAAVTNAATAEGGSPLVNRKSIKTQAGKRVVPIHDELVACGFLDFVREQAKHGKRLFPQLAYSKKGQCTAQFSKWFGRFLSHLGLDDPALVFHSFRHTFISKHAETGNPEIGKELVGHARTKKAAMARKRRNTRDGYRHSSLKVLVEEINGVRYEGLDLSPLYPKA